MKIASLFALLTLSLTSVATAQLSLSEKLKLWDAIVNPEYGETVLEKLDTTLDLSADQEEEVRVIFKRYQVETAPDVERFNLLLVEIVAAKKEGLGREKEIIKETKEVLVGVKEKIYSAQEEIGNLLNPAQLEKYEALFSENEKQVKKTVNYGKVKRG